VVSLRELADLVGGTLEGDPGLPIDRAAPFEQAGQGEITFVAHSRYLNKLKTCQASAVVVGREVQAPGFNLIRTDNPYLAFAKVLAHLHPPSVGPPGIQAGASVDSSASLEEGVAVYPGCVVGARVKIGRGTILFPNVVVYHDAFIGEECVLHAGAVVRERCRLGNRVVLQPGAVIGSDGFGFAADGTRYFKIPQVGHVEIEDDVEIGSASCGDRATMGGTRIRRGAKIDNLVQVGHNVEIGEDTILVSQVGISGSTRIGRHCVFGGQAGVSGHIEIGDFVTIGAKSGVANSVADNQTLSGAPVMPHKEWLRASMSFSKLPEIRRDVNRIKKRLEELGEFIKSKKER